MVRMGGVGVIHLGETVRDLPGLVIKCLFVIHRAGMAVNESGVLPIIGLKRSAVIALAMFKTLRKSLVRPFFMAGAVGVGRLRLP